MKISGFTCLLCAGGTSDNYVKIKCDFYDSHSRPTPLSTSKISISRAHQTMPRRCFVSQKTRRLLGVNVIKGGIRRTYGLCLTHFLDLGSIVGQSTIRLYANCFSPLMTGTLSQPKPADAVLVERACSTSHPVFLCKVNRGRHDSAATLRPVWGRSVRAVITLCP